MTSLLLVILLSGCGMPGPLYQTPDIKSSETPLNKNVTETNGQEIK